MEKVLISELNTLGMRAYDIADVLNVSENEVHDYLDREVKSCYQAEDYYLDIVWPNVQKSIKEWKEEFPLSERKEMRRRFLLEELHKSKNDPKKLHKISMEIKYFTGEIKGVTEEMIEKARQYPIASFFKYPLKLQICPLHCDFTPSFDIRGNFYFCYGCGANGDVIDFVMKTRNMSFQQAVIFLQ